MAVETRTDDASPTGLAIQRPCDDYFEFRFEEVATRVEQRFRRNYNADKIATAKVESQMEFEEISTGWWLVIKRLGLALWIGHDKPQIESGDLLTITFTKRGH